MYHVDNLANRLSSLEMLLYPKINHRNNEIYYEKIDTKIMYVGGDQDPDQSTLCIYIMLCMHVCVPMLLK